MTLDRFENEDGYLLESLPANRLEVDGNVQRGLNPDRVRLLARTFDETKLGVLVVSARSILPDSLSPASRQTRYVVLDGQTRLAALRLFMGTVETAYPVMCQVFRNLDRTEEAALFLGLNDRAAVRPVDKFRIALTAREQWALDLNEIVDRHGFVTDRGADSRRRFTAVTSARRVIAKEGGLRALDRALELLVRAWGHQPNTLSAESVEGVGLLYALHGDDVDTVKFASRLARKDNPRTFKANTMAMRGALRLSRADASYRYTLSVYNSGLRTGRIEAQEPGE